MTDERPIEYSTTNDVWFIPETQYADCGIAFRNALVCVRKRTGGYICGWWFDGNVSKLMPGLTPDEIFAMDGNERAKAEVRRIVEHIERRAA